MWCLNSEFQPRVNHCNSAIDSPLGDVPTGDQEWLVWRHGETGHRIHTLNLEAVSSPQEACKLWTANLEIWNEMTEQERKGVPADEPPTAEMAAGLRAMLANTRGVRAAGLRSMRSTTSLVSRMTRSSSLSTSAVRFEDSVMVR